MNGPAADHAGNAAAAESAAPAAGVDTLFAQVYDRLKGMTRRQVGATPEVVDTHISRKLWTPFPARVHVEAPAIACDVTCAIGLVDRYSNPFAKIS